MSNIENDVKYGLCDVCTIPRTHKSMNRVRMHHTENGTKV